jgi:hypothetical protein
MSWRVALIDSCGEWPGTIEAAAFVDASAREVKRCATLADAMGHGSRVARLLTDGDAVFELMLGQVFLGKGPASAAAVAAALDWAVAGGADLIHMSLGLSADREVLAAAVLRAVGAGCALVASAPARGSVVYPAAYPGVIRGTGDARCGPGELSCLGPGFFGGCPRWATSEGENCAGDVGAGASVAAGTSGGSSVGAAWVTRSILREPKSASAREAVDRVTARAIYWGPERR